MYSDENVVVVMIIMMTIIIANNRNLGQQLIKSLPQHFDEVVNRDVWLPWDVMKCILRLNESTPNHAKNRQNPLKKCTFFFNTGPTLINTISRYKFLTNITSKHHKSFGTTLYSHIFKILNSIAAFKPTILSYYVIVCAVV